MSSEIRYSQLSSPRQALVRLLQTVNFGRVEELEIHDGEPVFDPAPRVTFDIRLDLDEAARPELRLPDFALPAEVCRLIQQLDQLVRGTIARIEVRAGVPRRLSFETPAETPAAEVRR
jgi:hypothetical protein